MVTTQRMTFADLMAQPDDGYLHELVRGKILRVPPQATGHGRSSRHGFVEAALVEAIGRHLYDHAVSLGWQETHGRKVRNELVGRLMSGEAGVRFSLPDDPDQTRGLDVGYLSPEQVARLEDVPNDEYIREMPVLVVEVISPSETAEYINEKVADYLAAGARLVWLLYPRTRTAMVHRADGTAHTIPADGSLDGEDVLPGFSEPLFNIFA
jgi:Uma2 family endonuclease